MKNKLSIIGNGTAGTLAALHFNKYLPEYDIEVFYSSSIPATSVGEGSQLDFTYSLFNTINFQYKDYPLIDATHKDGISYEGWGDKGDYFHHFPLPHTGAHFNASKFQSVMKEKLQDKVSYIDQTINSYDEIDSDYIVDCRGTPKELNEEYYKLDSMAVNTAYVVQCYWDYPQFTHTKAIARPYGWMFAVPLANRLSLGYIFNRDINTLEDIKKDIDNPAKELGVELSDTTNYLEFNNYFHKQPFNERILLNGNKNYFLEPLEATSLSTAILVNQLATDKMANNMNDIDCNKIFNKHMLETELVIMLHYANGSKYDTPFWNNAKQKAWEIFERAPRRFKYIVSKLDTDWRNNKFLLEDALHVYGPNWYMANFEENIKGLGILNQLKELYKDSGFFEN